ncbi:MAG: hypothetical protein JO025_18790 [Verrucomicrobia bacterium]|nr:hypothetical protein [Verrucomicrobiota bacterium]
MVLLDLLTVAGVVLWLVFIFCVFGLVVARMVRWHWIFRQGAGLTAVFGLAGCILFLEIWNFFFAVNHASVAVLAGFTLGSAAVYRRTVVQVMRRWFLNQSVVAIGPLLILLLTVSLFGLGPSEHEHYDTGLYYLNSIRWAQHYPAIPGLANLHARLGYNQSTFLLVAFLSRMANLGLARACQVINPLFVFISGWAILDRIRLNVLSAKERRTRLYATLLLCPLLFLATHIYLSAPTSDIAAAAVALPAALALFCSLEEVFERNGVQAINWIFLLIVCACLSAKLKLSYIVLAALGIGMAATALALVKRRGFFSTWVRAGGLCVLLLLPWMARGVVLSGYAFYPSKFLRFHTDWAVPGRNAERESQWIYSWARMPGPDPDVVLKSNAWMGSWIERNVKDPENVFLALFLILGLAFGLSSFFIPTDQQRRLLPILLVVQTLCAVIFWFKTAPEPRFGYAAILLCGVNGFYAFTTAVIGLSRVRAGLCACMITLGSFSLIGRTQFPMIRSLEKKFPQGFPKAEIEFQTTNSGLKIGVAIHQQVWDSGLLVTPHCDPALTLRGPGLREGFRIMHEATTEEEESTANGHE